MVHKVIEVGRHDKFAVNLAETLGHLLLGIEDDDLLQETRFAAARNVKRNITCLLYTSPSPRDQRGSRMPSSA